MSLPLFNFNFHSTMRFLYPLALFLFWSLPATAAQKPNLVFMIADDCTYLDMEVYGGQAKTPNLNQLAKQGLKFTRDRKSVV